MFDNLKCITRSFGSAATYVADRMEHANIESNCDDAISIAKKVKTLKGEGRLACELFNSFQNNKRFNLTIEDLPEDDEEDGEEN